MANCKLDLFDLLTGSPDTDGCWYFVSVTGTYGGSLDISDDGITYYTTTLAEGALMENPPDVDAGDAMWVDLEGLPATQFVFAYVTPCPGEDTYNANWENEVCYKVSTITANKGTVENDLEVEHCVEETGLNLYDDAGVTSGEYSIEECTGGGDCSEFNLGTGDYDPYANDIDVGAYVFRFELLNSCDNVSFYLTVNIVAAPDMGDVQTGTACDDPVA